MVPRARYRPAAVSVFGRRRVFPRLQSWM